MPEPLAGELTIPVAGVAPAAAGAGALTPPAALAVPPIGAGVVLSSSSPQPTSESAAMVPALKMKPSFLRFFICSYPLGKRGESIREETTIVKQTA